MSDESNSISARESYTKKEKELIMKKINEEIEKDKEKKNNAIKENQKNISETDKESIQNIFVRIFPSDKDWISQFNHFIACLDKSAIMKNARKTGYNLGTGKILNDRCYKKNNALIMNFYFTIPPEDEPEPKPEPEPDAEPPAKYLPYFDSNDIYKLATVFLDKLYENLGDNIPRRIDETLSKKFSPHPYYYDTENKENKYYNDTYKKYIYFTVALEVINILFYLNGRSCRFWTSGNFIKKLDKIAGCIDRKNFGHVEEPADDEGEEDELGNSTGGKKTRRKTKRHKTRRTKKKTYKLKGRRKYRK